MALLAHRGPLPWSGPSRTTGRPPQTTAPAWVVIDQVASLTDANAVALHARLQPRGRDTLTASFDSDLLGDPLESLRYEIVDGTDDLPDSVGDVEFYVPPCVPGRLGGPRAAADDRPPRPADHDRGRRQLPPGRAAGRHPLQLRSIDSSTAELALTLTPPRCGGSRTSSGAQDRREWQGRWRPSLADQRVLLRVAIGEAIEARLRPFEVDVVRVARRGRDGVHPIAELPRLLPDADVVILIVPLTDETRGLVDAAFLARMKDGALLVNVARGPVVDTDALLAELTSGRLSAAVDVTD